MSQWKRISIFRKGLPAVIVFSMLATATLSSAAAPGGTIGSSEAVSAASSGGTTMQTGDSDPLRFPADNYTEETVTVTTSSGDVEVTYRLYEHLTYVANPVDTNYQSMNVKVPVKINGVDVDATHAPILFVIGVGGYMSSSNVGGGLSGAPGGPMHGAPPNGGMGGAPGANSGVSGSSDLALAAGYVVAEPGCRGRDNQAADGTYYGKAPAAIVDLKAAVRYLRYNDDLMPGSAEWIISTGGSAGGALSALLAASGSSPLYDSYLEALGAADEDDSIFASASFSAITDLDHADLAYEWEFGSIPTQGAVVDQAISQQLAAAFADYLATLNLQGENGFGTITAANYGEYLVQTTLIPAANKYLLALSEDDRAAYLAENPWITWADNAASFTFADYAAHDGRMKGLPAFDSFDLTTPENLLFGSETINARHFTAFGVQHTSGDPTAQVAGDLQTVVNLMNPMYFITQGGSTIAPHWWIRHGTRDSDTSLAIITDLAISLQNQGKDVNAKLYWDGGHAVDQDPEDFIAWIGQITGYAA